MKEKDDLRLLADRIGRYSEAPPPAELAGHFLCLWTNSITADGPLQATVIPDGCVDLLWRDGRFIVVGPDISAARPTVSPGTIIGLRFRPGAAWHWLGVPLDELVGIEVPLSEIWGAEGAEIADRLNDQPTTAARIGAFQRLVARHRADVAAPPPEASAMVALLRKAPSESAARITALPDCLNMSERTLRRWSHRHFGYGPKTLDRILRLKRLQHLAEAGPDTALAGLAFEAGYADQAHLGREVQDLCGMTAAEFVQQLVR